MGVEEKPGDQSGGAGRSPSSPSYAAYAVKIERLNHRRPAGSCSGPLWRDQFTDEGNAGVPERSITVEVYRELPEPRSYE